MAINVTQAIGVGVDHAAMVRWIWERSSGNLIGPRPPAPADKTQPKPELRPLADATHGSYHWILLASPGPGGETIAMWRFDGVRRAWSWLKPDGQADGYSGGFGTTGLQDAYSAGHRYHAAVFEPWVADDLVASGAAQHETITELSAQVARRDDIIRNLMKMDAERDARVRQLEAEAMALQMGNAILTVKLGEKGADTKPAPFPARALRVGAQDIGVRVGS